jgi:Zn-dependent M16 (insulinase) family peptidase
MNPGPSRPEKAQMHPPPCLPPPLFSIFPFYPSTFRRTHVHRSSRISLPKPGTRFGRFVLESVDPLEEYKSFGLTFREEISGCEIYHVWNEDEENLFSFNFKTIPEDGTGVAHILEHTVLCGSEKYPVKDPFVMLYKGSMQTFLNAMTYPDKTVYPASSTVKADLFNLMSVYADAVFFPLLKEEHFRQEGHRLERGADGEAQIAGVVYNEMKANYSTHDDIAWDKVIRSVFPDTPYAWDSGGDPREIPSLRYSYFRDFHRRYYHPSNCRIFLYGDIPSEEYLEFLDRKCSPGSPTRNWRRDRVSTSLCSPDGTSPGSSASVFPSPRMTAATAPRLPPTALR